VVMNTKVDWESGLPEVPEELCPGPASDIQGWQWGRDKRENRQDYSQLIMKMCDGSTRRALMQPQGSILGLEADIEEMSGNKTIGKLDTDTLRQEEWKDDMCSSEGHLEIDPESQVTLVGCQDDEDGQVLTIVSTKHLFKSGVYRLCLQACK